MNRTIKFRGKRLDNGEWVVGDLLHIAGGCLIYFGSDTDTTDPDIENSSPIAVKLLNDEVAVVDPDTIGPFVGLLDKNGKEIYEDDRVNVLQAERNFDIVVKWSNEAMAFMACYADGKQSPFSWFTNLRIYQLTVIGNIHDNPELISDK